MEEDNKKEIMYFQCDKKLKADFYKIAQTKKVSPGALLRAFMRKVIKTNFESENIKNEKDNHLDFDDNE